MGQGEMHAMGQGEMGVSFNRTTARGSRQRYHVVVAFVLTALYVAVKAFDHDYWSVGFGLAFLGLILVTPAAEQQAEAWRQHALRVVSACFVVVTLASIGTTLLTWSH